MRSVSRMMTGLLLGSALVLPSLASAQEAPPSRPRAGQGDMRGAMMNADSRREAMERYRASQRPAEQARPAPTTPAPTRDWNREGNRDDRRPATATPGPQAPRAGTTPPDRNWSSDRRTWDRDGDRNWSTDRGRWDGENRRDGRPTPPPPGTPNAGGDRRDRDGRNWDGRDRDGRDGRAGDGRGWDGRGADRVDQNRRDRDWRERDGRGWDRADRDGRSWDRNDGRRDDRRWDRAWRDDRRYDWRGYRDSHRNVYRLPRYVAPRPGFSYRRWYPGYRFDPWFYGSSYWIGNPWQYRLPPAYGDFRWVRYYDDAVLVDLRSGEIVDIIYDVFF
ncbi:RcnB family protein [Rhizorhabdus sp.]|uniref:RcnB family protein n=2 Tax=Rhizorhabdus sp. TaxID=1968843 RepID=UPI0025CC4CC3|nr:RcnB family protein [Rhizorhabdus sp.]